MQVTLTHYRGLLGRYLAPQRGSAALLAALLLVGIALQLAAPQVIRAFIDATQAGVSGAPLMAAGALFLTLTLAQRALSLGAVYLGEQVGWRATNALRGDLTDHVLRLDMGFHKQHTPGELIERVDGDTAALAGFFSSLAVQVLGNALLVLGILALLFRESWLVGVGLTIYALAVLGALAAVQRVAVRRWVATSRAGAELFGFLEERISGTEDIRASGAEGYVLARHAGLARAALGAERGALMASNVAFVVTNFLQALGVALGLGLAAWLYGRGEVTIGTAFMVVYYVGMLGGPLERIREQAETFQRAAGGFERIAELLALRPRVVEAPGATLPAGPLAVELDGVSFAYDDAAGDDGRQVLGDIRLRLAPGRVLGLLGRTGSGKSTLTRLLLRLYDPSAGSVRLGGCDLRDLALDDLRGRVAMVTQDVQLFNATVRENLTLFRRGIDDGALERALRELGLWEWVCGLPEGLGTRLGAGGVGVSAGEAQLLAFARVFLRDPGLVILDEASSRLDPATERLLERAIGRLLAGRTGLVIAHRLATVQRADEILILDDGRVAEHGPRAALAADPESRFAQLLRVGMEEVLA